MEEWDATPVGPELRESFNVAPTNRVYAVVEHLDEQSGGQVERQVRNLQWGLVPSWSKDPKIGSRLINARVETLAEKPSWRAAFRKRRAVVPARATTSGRLAGRAARLPSNRSICTRPVTGSWRLPACTRCGATEQGRRRPG